MLLTVYFPPGRGRLREASTEERVEFDPLVTEVERCIVVGGLPQEWRSLLSYGAIAWSGESLQLWRVEGCSVIQVKRWELKAYPDKIESFFGSFAMGGVFVFE